MSGGQERETLGARLVNSFLLPEVFLLPVCTNGIDPGMKDNLVSN